jgi:hypothetical protein
MDLPQEVLDLLPSWKEMGYEPHCVFVRKGEDAVPVVFRTLTKKEFSVLSQQPVGDLESVVLGPMFTSPYQNILKTAVLWPNPIPDEYPSATDRMVSEAIIEASAWVSTEALQTGLQEARDSASSLEGFLASRIHVAFPFMDPRVVDGMTFNSMMRHVALSEIMTGVQVDLQPFLDPEGYQKRLEREERQAKKQRQEIEAGIKPADPRMRDPAFRKRMTQLAEESRQRLREKRNVSAQDFETDNRALDSLWGRKT